MAPARSSRSAMDNNLENFKATERRSSALENEEVQKFVGFRKISQEDLHLIDELASFPRDMRIMGLHNLFNMGKEKSDIDLENSIQNADNEQSKAMYTVAREFYNKYDWMTALSLVRVLEKI